MELIIFLAILIVAIFLWADGKIKIPTAVKKFPINLFFFLSLLFLFILLFSIAALMWGGGDGYGFVLVFFPSAILFVISSLLTLILTKGFPGRLVKKDVAIQDNVPIKIEKEHLLKRIFKASKSLSYHFPANGLFFIGLIFIFIGLYSFSIFFSLYVQLFSGGCVGCGLGGVLGITPFLSFFLSYCFIYWASSLKNNNIGDLLEKEVTLGKKTFIVFSVLSFLIITFFTILMFILPSMALYLLTYILF